jgi:AraC-like DNA-binding protein
MRPDTTTRLVFQNAAQSPLGRITLSGLIRDCVGLVDTPRRVLRAYALVYVLDGGGEYIDPAGVQEVNAGDLLLIFPDVPHTYHRTPGRHWDEFYIVFDGPVFDLWRKEGLITPSRTRYHLDPVDYWRKRMEEIVARPGAARLGTTPGQVCQLQQFIADVLHVTAQAEEEAGQGWLAAACGRLRRHVGGDDAAVRHVAQTLGMSYESFRKRFVRLAGVPPKRFRMQCAIEEACHLLQQRELPLRTIAGRCGFCDEFHLSRRFKQLLGVSPSDFRRQMGIG